MQEFNNQQPPNHFQLKAKTSPQVEKKFDSNQKPWSVQVKREGTTGIPARHRHRWYWIGDRQRDGSRYRGGSNKVEKANVLYAKVLFILLLSDQAIMRDIKCRCVVYRGQIWRLSFLFFDLWVINKCISIKVKNKKVVTYKIKPKKSIL